MAVGGVKGTLQTPEDELLDFSLQHAFDFSQTRGYLLRVSVSGGSQNLLEILDVGQDGLAGSEEQTQFESAVMALTKLYADSGLYGTIRALLAL